ncbi:hypothetical protein FOA52_007627 [Chlamydomonas sp. UWO 241]|nr:hypothetical protein FOA52_007627 [Chlamydomonas sp. UWO 241]
MGSLDKIKDDAKALERFKRTFDKFVVLDKLDGVSALLVCDGDGRMKMYTRGDGTYGQDVSHLLAYVEGIPTNDPGTIVIVRGELIISKKRFAGMSRDANANARNTAAGIINTKAGSENAGLASNLTFMAYNLILHDDVWVNVKGQTALEILERAGFKTVEAIGIGRADLTFDRLSDLLEERRRLSPYEIDGLVVATDTDNEVRADKNPDYAFAYKSSLGQERAKVVVTKVVWSVSKNGLMKPVVAFESVNLGGVNIARATGFNAAYIKENKIGPGARLILIRSGDVIPHIESVVSGARQAQMPDLRGKDYEWRGKDIALSQPSEEQDLKEMIHFFEVIPVDDVGPGLVSKLHAAGYGTVPQVLKMTLAEFTAVPGLGAKARVHKDIQDRVASATCSQLMVASNAFGQGIGERKIEAILRGLKNAKNPSVEDLVSIPGVSDIIARKYVAGLKKYDAFVNAASLKKIVASACAASKAPKKNETGKWAGQVVVFTGVRDKALEKEIERGGGRVSTSVSKNTTLVFAKDPDESSNKLDLARSLGIKIVAYSKVS